MHNFVIRLRPDTKAELYSDVSDSLMGFILIEAILIILVAGKPGALDALEDAEREQEYPENQFDVSMDYLMEVNETLNMEAGVFLNPVEYEPNSDIHAQMCLKLTDTIESVEDANDISELLALKSVFYDPMIVDGFKFVAMHYPDRVSFCIIPKAVANMKTDVTLAGLLQDYEINHDPNPWGFLDPANLSFENGLFYQRS